MASIRTTDPASRSSPDLHWRRLNADDVPNLCHTAAIIHPELPEDDEVFAERVHLFPEGCFGLMESSGRSRELYGYAISHPIIFRETPRLNKLLGQVSPSANQYYIHDFAILPNARGQGHAQEGIRMILEVAAACSTTALISVYGTSPFWKRYGFVEVADLTAEVQEKIRGYGDDATYLERNNQGT